MSRSLIGSGGVNLPGAMRSTGGTWLNGSSGTAYYQAPPVVNVLTTVNRGLQQGNVALVMPSASPVYTTPTFGTPRRYDTIPGLVKR